MFDYSKLKNYRKQKGFKQYEFAKKIGISVPALQGFEYGKFEPKIENVLKMANALDINPTLLMDEGFQNLFQLNKELSDYTTKELLEEIERRCQS